MTSIWLFIKEIDDINRGVLAGRKKIKESQTLDFIQNFVKLIITLIAFYVVGFNSQALSIAFVVSFLLIIPLGAYYVIQDMRSWQNADKKFSIGEQFDFAREIISFGLVATFISTLWTIIQYTDRIMLGQLTNDALNKIAVYSIALGLANLVVIFPGAITGIFFPLMSELFGAGKLDAMNKTLRIAMKWLIMITVPFAIILGIFGDKLLIMFYGSVYAEGATVLLFFVAGLFLWSIFSLPQIILAAMRRLDVELKAAVAAMVTNVILNYFFIPMWGINGSALASFMSLIVASILVYYYSAKTFNFSFPVEAYKPLIAGLISLIIIFLLKDPVLLFVNTYLPVDSLSFAGDQMFAELLQKLIKLTIFGLLFLLSVTIYFTLLLLLKSFAEEEISVLEAALRRAKIPDKYIAYVRVFLEAKWLRFGGSLS
jgi:O-antigen/teichoic acid export membrane protein